MIFESSKRIYDKSSGKYLSAEWVLDTEKQLVIHTDTAMNVTKRSFFQDCIKYHLSYRAENNPDSLQKLVNEGNILEYLERFVEKVTDAVNNQADLWLENNKEYQIAVEKSDIYTQEQIANAVKISAQHEIYNVIVYV